MRFWVRFLFTLVVLVTATRARAAEIIGATCAAAGTRIVHGDRLGDFPKEAAPEPTLSFGEGGRSGVRGVSLPAVTQAMEEDQGCIDRVRGDEFDGPQVPCSFDGGDIDPVTAFRRISFDIAPSESVRVPILRAVQGVRAGLRSSLERPPRRA